MSLAMNDKLPVPLDAKWSVQQRNAARLLAIGYTVAMAAKATGYSVRQIYRLNNDPDFDDYVQALHAYAWQRVEPGIMANALLAITVQRQMFLGEITASDERYREASKLIDRLLDRLLYIEPPPPADSEGSVGPTAAVQVNVNGRHE